MTPEEFDRRVQFLVEHQAQFDVRMDRLEESLRRLFESHSTLSAVVTQLVGLVEDHDKRFKIVEEKFIALAEAQKRTEEHLLHTDEHLLHTDERLNALIDIVDKHLTGGNGRKPKK